MKTKGYWLLKKCVALNVVFRFAVILLCVLLVFVIFNAFVYEKGMQIQKSNLVTLKNLSLALSGKALKKESTKKKKDIYDVLFKSKHEKEEDIFRVIEDACKKNEINLVTMRTEIKEQEHDLNRENYKLMISGNYSGLLGFLEMISKAQVNMSFFDVVLMPENPEEKGEALHLSLVMHVYRERE